MTAADFLPERRTLPSLREAVQGCRGCPLYERATQAVFGEGRPRVRAMMVGEQPGDEEDLAGHPFVGPAGRLLDQMMEAAALPRDQIYVTNAVKHFKWKPRGKRRMHEKPSASEVDACRPWLEAELAAVEPEVLILLGATAAQALLGRKFRVTRSRGQLFESPFAPRTLATVHPSSLLRMPDPDARRAAREEFIRELALVASALSAPGAAARR
ncbi:MAG TPA: UdgX family uracil-DNA binding protein [Kofleriaceae bacterium]|nr:UdgX family uracil-DNA binding protein [Kofleriaceae bacterium]